MSLEISNRLTNMLKKVAQDAMRKAIRECSREYGFDEEEALVRLKIEELRIREKGKVKGKEKGNKKEKSKYPLPYNNEYDRECCEALRLNQGLYTQCENKKEEGEMYCKYCEKRKDGEMPEYGTIHMRIEKNIMGYVDPKGRKPTAYTKIMKRLNITKEEVQEEAEKRGKSIDEVHFEEVEQRRGRPTAKKEKVVKGVKGRPKKSKKVLEVNGESVEEDIFASLVANAVEEEKSKKGVDEILENFVSEMSEMSEKKEEEVVEEVVEEKEEREKEREEKRKEKELKEKEREEKRKEKELKEKEREEKRKEKELKEKEREEKRKEKELKEKEREEKRKEKELKEKEREVKKAEVCEVVEAKKASEVVEVKKASEVSTEEEKYKKIVYNGIKYIVSRKSWIAYDYDKYVNGNYLVVVGKYDEKTKEIEKIEKEVSSEEEVSSDEEEEEEYDE